MTLTPAHSLAALTEIAQDWPLFYPLCIFNEVTERGKIGPGMVLQRAELGSDTVPSICVIFHQLSHRAGVNLFSVTDIFRAQAPPLAQRKGTF